MLFGHQNDDTNTGEVTVPTTTDDTAMNPLAVDPNTGVSLPAPTTQTDSATTEKEETSVLDQPNQTDSAASAPIVEPESPFNNDSAATVSATRVAPTAAGASSSDLLNLKQEALAQLTPLVNHLDQTPEEKFRTTLMLIQSADNQALLNDAYQAALAITDDKARAQALLDVVNEINYFTQPKPEN